jgi:hypothetical protein
MVSLQTRDREQEFSGLWRIAAAMRHLDSAKPSTELRLALDVDFRPNNISGYGQLLLAYIKKRDPRSLGN